MLESQKKPRLDRDAPPRPLDIDPIPAPTHPTKRTRAINYALAASMVIIGLSLVMIFSWALKSDDVIKVNNAPFPVRTIRDHPMANGVVILEIDLCKKTSKRGRVRTSFVSSSREIFLPLADENMSKGCIKREIPVIIPEDTPPGTYKIKFRAIYDLSPLKKGIISEFESQEFVVDPPTKEQ